MRIENLPYGKAVFLPHSKGDELDFLRSAKYPLPGNMDDACKSAVLHAILRKESSQYKLIGDTTVYYFGKDLSVVLSVSAQPYIADWPKWHETTEFQILFDRLQAPYFKISDSNDNFPSYDVELKSTNPNRTWRGYYGANEIKVRVSSYHVAIIDTLLGPNVYYVKRIG